MIQHNAVCETNNQKKPTHTHTQREKEQQLILKKTFVRAKINGKQRKSRRPCNSKVNCLPFGWVIMRWHIDISNTLCVGFYAIDK